MSDCGFQPFRDGAYGHWTCSLPKRHRGRHRYINYTISRVPRLHSGVWVVLRAWLRQRRRVIKHMVKYKKRPRVALTPAYGLHWRSHIWPTEYDPIEPKQAAGCA